MPSPTEAGDTAVAPPRRSRRRRVLQISGSLLGGLLAAAAVAAAVIHVPYVIESPGSATALNRQVVTISGAPAYQHPGRVLFLTVQVTTSDPNLYRYLFASLSSSDDVVKKQDVLGCASYAADARLNTLLMRDSQDAAKEVALRRVGYPVQHLGDVPLILDLQCGGPSDQHLQVGDLITAVDGQAVATSTDVGRVVRSQPAGAVVQVTVRRGAQTLTVPVHAGHLGKSAFLGIVTQTLSTWRFPVSVTINTQMIGGPSAGLAFTLALVNDLSPHDITGGRQVAVTGAIFSDGTVGPVGGVAQKAIAAKRDHATALIVPAGSEKEARDHASGLHVVAVHNIEDALNALHQLGGAAVSGAPLSALPSQ